MTRAETCRPIDGVALRGDRSDHVLRLRVVRSADSETSSEGRPSEQSTEQDLIGRALDGNADAMRELVEMLRPAVQAEVAWTLTRFAPYGRGRDTRQEMADMVQEVFLSLFDDGAKTLRAWDPKRGRTLISFVKLIARHQVVSILRSNRRCPWTEEPTPVDRMSLAPSPSPEQRVVDADEAERVVGALRSELSTRGMMMFEGLYVQERSVDEVCEEFGMSRDALYAWRSRLKRKVQSVLQRLRGPENNR